MKAIPILLSIVLLLCFVGGVRSQTGSDSARRPVLKLGPEVEYYAPKSESRDIRTVNINVFGGLEFEPLSFLRFSCYGGLTATYAWGSITQWDENFNDVSYPSTAFGLGPAFLLRLEPKLTPWLSLSLDASGAVILYSTHFPAGGDIYNFMWRIGPAAIFRIDNHYALSAGLRWMHVSNGQGLNYHNPSYEGSGGHIGITRYF